MENKKLVPEIRFKGFQDEWETKKLGEISTYISSNYSITSALEYGKYNIYDANKCIGYINRYLCNKDYISIIKDGSGVGRTMYMKAYSNFIGTMGGIIPNNNINPYFVYSLMSNINFKQYIKGATIPHVYYSDYNKHLIFIPTYKEQEKIGNYFYKLDEFISLNKKKIKKLLNIKNTLLQKMFPQDDSSVPEIRFKGFTEKWEKKKFIDIFQFLKNNTYSRKLLVYHYGSVKNIHYGDILTILNYHIDYNNNEIPYIQNNVKIVGDYLSNGDIVFTDTAEDDTVGKCVELCNVKNNIVAGLHTYPCRANIKFAKYYLGYLLNSYYFHNQLIPLIQGTKVCSLSKSAFFSTQIIYPNIVEQEKIGNYFYKLDKLICLYEKEIEKLTNLKKAFLKKMFV